MLIYFFHFFPISQLVAEALRIIVDIMEMMKLRKTAIEVIAVFVRNLFSVLSIEL